MIRDYYAHVRFSSIARKISHGLFKSCWRLTGKVLSRYISIPPPFCGTYLSVKKTGYLPYRLLACTEKLHIFHVIVLLK